MGGEFIVGKKSLMEEVEKKKESDKLKKILHKKQKKQQKQTKKGRRNKNNLVKKKKKRARGRLRETIKLQLLKNGGTPKGKQFKGEGGGHGEHDQRSRDYAPLVGLRPNH